MIIADYLVSELLTAISQRLIGLIAQQRLAPFDYSVHSTQYFVTPADQVSHARAFEGPE